MKVADRIEKLIKAGEIKPGKDGWQGMNIPVIDHRYNKPDLFAQVNGRRDRDGDPAIHVINKYKQLETLKKRGWIVAPLPVKKPVTRKSTSKAPTKTDE